MRYELTANKPANIAVLAGWLVMGEQVGLPTLASLFLILAGVGVVFARKT
jgi:multidrug transporter EmrE-like cation transporter